MRIPFGLFDALSCLNSVSSDIVTDMCRSVLSCLDGSSRLPVSKDYMTRISLNSPSHSMNEEDITNVINSLVWIFREMSLCRENPSSVLATIRTRTPKAIDHLGLILSVWDESIESGDFSGVEGFTIGKLIDIDWAVGSDLGTNKFGDMNHVFVKLSLKVQTPSGTVETRVVEVDASEFDSIVQSFREMNQLVQSL